MKTRSIVFVSMTAVAVMLTGLWSPAFAYNQTGYQVPNSDGFGDCGYCHRPGWTGVSYGPHSGYTKNTNACSTCHTVHGAAGDLQLLPGDTVKAACQICHDGSGGRGVYGTIAKRGLTVGATHGIETTSLVPGGSASSGGDATMTLSGPNGTLTCTDCHSPHGADTVAAFLGERQREPAFGNLPVPTSSRLLKKRPGGAAAPVAEYGSDWCLACHKGRASGMAGLANHPVESLNTTATPYNYRRLGIIGPGPYPTSVTTLGPAGINTQFSGSNRAYLMLYPRTGAQAGHFPICQQCHEDTRDVGSLSADGSQATPTTTTVTTGNWAGINPSDNPRFQLFPHETMGYRLLVEAATTSQTDDLCLNCHPAGVLP